MCLPKKRNINSIDVLLDDRGGEGKGEGDLLIKAEIMASFFGRLGLELVCANMLSAACDNHL